MTICSFSVVRPVATIVLMLILIVFGLIGLRSMPVREYPDIDVPTISITTEYDGASASVVETKITEIIEGTVAGIEGLDSIESTSQDGRSRVTLEFSVNRDIDAAAFAEQLMGTLLDLRLNGTSREELSLFGRTILRGAATRQGIELIDRRP